MHNDIIAGVITGLLFAPKAGKETRADIVISICDLLESGKKVVNKYKKKNKVNSFAFGSVVGVTAGMVAGLLLTAKVIKKKIAKQYLLCKQVKCPELFYKSCEKVAVGANEKVYKVNKTANGFKGQVKKIR